MPNFKGKGLRLLLGSPEAEQPLKHQAEGQPLPGLYSELHYQTLTLRNSRVTVLEGERFSLWFRVCWEAHLLESSP